MKVLAIVPTLSENSGAGRLCFRTFAEIARAHEVIILSGMPHALALPGVLTPLRSNRSVNIFVRNCLMARRSAKGRDIVHAIDVWPYGVYGFFAVLGTQRRLMITGVGTYSVAPLNNRTTGFLSKWAYRRSSSIPCISHYVESKIKEIIPAVKTCVIHMGTTYLPTAQAVNLSETRREYGLTETNSPIVITVGEVKERKGQLDTLKGLALLKEKFPDFIYLVVGNQSSHYVEAMKSFAAENGLRKNLIFAVNVSSDKELSALYQISDIQSLMSNNDESHFEGFGLTLLEGAQFGIPAIGSKNCGIEDAINDGVSGILVQQKDHQSIADSIVTIMENYKHFRDGSLKWYNNFSWGKSAAELSHIYQQIV